MALFNLIKKNNNDIKTENTHQSAPRTHMSEELNKDISEFEESSKNIKTNLHDKININIQHDNALIKDDKEILDNSINSSSNNSNTSIDETIILEDIEKIKKEIEEEKNIENKKEQNDLKESRKEKKISEIATLAMSRPAENAFDLGCKRFIDDDSEVIKFDIFGTEEDLKSLINKNPKIKFLDISDCRYINDFSILSNLKNLEHLDLSGNKNITDISFLKGLNNLTILNIGITGIETLENFPYLPNLKVLNLKMNKIKDLKGIEKQTELTDIVLWGSSVADISVLSYFKKLRALDFDSCSNIKDFSPISDLKKLMYLNFSNVKLNTFSFLKNLEKLSFLIIDTVSGVVSNEDLSNFENLVNMKYLQLKNMMIRDLTYFKNMKKMQHLDLTGNSITDLTPIEDLTEITNLILSNNLALTDLSPLHKMSKMKKLKLNGLGSVKNDKGLSNTTMTFSDISVVKFMPNLATFEANNNGKIRDISPLQNCLNLEEVAFNNCLLISDATPLRFCKKLQTISFANDIQIKDFSFVKYLKDMVEINVANTGINELIISNYTNLLSASIWSFGNSYSPIYKANVSSAKGRKGITKSYKKYIKEEDCE